MVRSKKWQEEDSKEEVIHVNVDSQKRKEVPESEDMVALEEESDSKKNTLGSIPPGLASVARKVVQ